MVRSVCYDCVVSNSSYYLILSSLLTFCIIILSLYWSYHFFSVSFCLVHLFFVGSFYLFINSFFLVRFCRIWLRFISFLSTFLQMCSSSSIIIISLRNSILTFLPLLILVLPLSRLRFLNSAYVLYIIQ